MWRPMFLLCAVLGCASEATEPAQGTLSAAAASQVSVLLLQVDRYQLDRVTFTSATTANDQIELGVMSQSGNQLTLTPDEWTCPGTRGTYQMTIPADAEIDPQGAATLVYEPSSAGIHELVTIQGGCYDGSGGFSPRPVGPQF